MPTRIQRDDQQSDLLSTIRENQAAMIDLVRSWTDVSHQFTRNLPQPVAGASISGFVDGMFDLAEQTLAAQRQLALALAGVATRQTDTAMELAESSTRESLSGVEAVVEAVDREQEPRDREDTEQPRAAKGDAPRKDAARKQDSKVDRRPFEERSVEELRDRAGELEIEGRSAMGKDELVAALRERSK